MNKERKERIKQYKLIFDEIFKELISEGKNFKVVFTNAKKEEYGNEFEADIVNVNGYEDSLDFKSNLFGMANDSIKMIENASKEPSINRSEFLQYISDHIESLIKLGHSRKNLKNNKTYYYFYNINFKDEENNNYSSLNEYAMINRKSLYDEYFWEELANYGEQWMKTYDYLVGKINKLISETESGGEYNDSMTNSEDKKEERRSKIKHGANPIDVQQTATRKTVSFDNSTLDEIFLSDYINDFIEYEKRLISEDYFDITGKWIKTKIGLVRFILVLKEFGYFRKNKSNINIRKFFENRYNLKINEYFKPVKLKNIDYKSYYHFINDKRND